MVIASLLSNCWLHRAMRGVKRNKCHDENDVSKVMTDTANDDIISKVSTKFVDSSTYKKHTSFTTKLLKSESPKYVHTHDPFLDRFIECLHDTAVLLDNRGIIKGYNRKGQKVFYKAIKHNTSILGFITSAEIESLISAVKEFTAWHGIITIVVSKERTSIDRIQNSIDAVEEDFNNYVMQQVDSSKELDSLSAKAFLYPFDKNVLLFVVINNKELTILTDTVLYGLSKTQLRLLSSIYPRHVIDYLISRSSKHSDISSISMFHMNIGIMFIDIVGWTTIASSLTPHQVFSFLNDLYGRFDNILDSFNLFKLETVGDCYVVVAGLVEPADKVSFKIKDKRGSNEIVKEMFALYCCGQEVLKTVDRMTFPDIQQTNVKLRIGMHIGSVFSGIVGHQMPKFCLYGDTMNIASRMESTAPVDHIQMSDCFYKIIEVKLKERGIPHQIRQVDVKGKGIMQTHLCEKQASDYMDNMQAKSDTREIACSNKNDLSAIVSLANYVQKRKIKVSFDLTRYAETLQPISESNTYGEISDDTIGLPLHNSIANFVLCTR